MITERQNDMRMDLLKNLKEKIVKTYQMIYFDEGLDENYIDAFFKEVKEEILE